MDCGGFVCLSFILLILFHPSTLSSESFSSSILLLLPQLTSSIIIFIFIFFLLVLFHLAFLHFLQCHLMYGASLEVVMDKFSTLASPNCRNFVAGSKHFIRSGMGSLESIMALKNHSRFKYVHYSQFPGQSKDKVFVFKM